MRIAIGADHRGFEHKNYIKEQVNIPDKTIDWIDVGCFDAQYCDYPEFAILVAQSMKQKKADWGVLICGSGIGMAITANRFNEIYAALVWNEEVACLSKEHDKANVLVLPSDFVTLEQSVTMVQRWLIAEFLGGRYQKRIDMIDALGGL